MVITFNEEINMESDRKILDELQGLCYDFKAGTSTAKALLAVGAKYLNLDPKYIQDLYNESMSGTSEGKAILALGAAYLSRKKSE